MISIANDSFTANVNPESSDDNLFAEETYQQEVDRIAEIEQQQRLQQIEADKTTDGISGVAANKINRVAANKINRVAANKTNRVAASEGASSGSKIRARRKGSARSKRNASKSGRGFQKSENFNKFSNCLSR